jgi:hypothetical protein
MNKWEAVRISADMWNVWKGDEFCGYIHRVADGWRVDMQRATRPTLQEAAKDAWGQEAADAIWAAEAT